MLKTDIRLIIIYLTAVVIIGCNKIEYITADKDSSLNKQDYIADGFPEKIGSFDELEKAYNVLYSYLDNNPDKLPKVNSSKSKDIFNILINRNIEEVVKNIETYDEKLQFLLKYHTNDGYPLSSVYLEADLKEKLYDNEILLIKSFEIHTRLLFYEIYDNELNSNEEYRKEHMITEEHMRLISHSLGKELLGLKIFIEMHKELDPYLISITNKKLQKYIERSKKINILSIEYEEYDL